MTSYRAISRLLLSFSIFQGAPHLAQANPITVPSDQHFFQMIEFPGNASTPWEPKKFELFDPDGTRLTLVEAACFMSGIFDKRSTGGFTALIIPDDDGWAVYLGGSSSSAKFYFSCLRRAG